MRDSRRPPVEELCSLARPRPAAALWPARAPPPWRRRGLRGAPGRPGHCLLGDGRQQAGGDLSLRQLAGRAKHTALPCEQQQQQRSPMHTMACRRSTPLVTADVSQRTQPRSASWAVAGQPKWHSRAATGAARVLRSLSAAGRVREGKGQRVGRVQRWAPPAPQARPRRHTTHLRPPAAARAPGWCRPAAARHA